MARIHPLWLDKIVCSNCPPGKILPVLPFEQCWPDTTRAVLYFIGLVYFFLGVAIVSDIFMASIEKITSKTRKAFVKFEYEGQIHYKVYDDKVWNDTVANLTLMALGSSAPEILLSCIEIVSNKFTPGNLGAGTIVGSAAFNLLFITAVCIISVPKGEIRRIKTIKVFIVTSLFSLFAYFWMIITLNLISPNEITLWEGIVTLLLFPLLVFIAWWADHDFCYRGRRTRNWSLLVEEDGKRTELPYGEVNPLYKDGIVNQEELASLYHRWRSINPELSEEETASLVARKLINDGGHSHLWYRSGVSRKLMGGPQLVPILDEKLNEVYNVLNNTSKSDQGIHPLNQIYDSKKAIIEFEAASIAVMENVGVVNVKLLRNGRLDIEVPVKVETFDGNANAFSDYAPFSYVVTFAPQVTEIEIPVTIVDDKQWEPEEEFFIRATVPADNPDFQMGKIPIMEVVILDDDDPGSISFTLRGKSVKQDSGTVELALKRSNGCDGIVKFRYKTLDGTALCPDDYVETKGEIILQHGEIDATISVSIVNKDSGGKNAYFFVVLEKPGGGLHLGDVSKIKITISNDDLQDELAIEKVLQLAAENVESMQLGHETYSAQFNDAVAVNGGDTENATKMDYILHVIAFPWKVLFACIPPVGYCQGWLCFIVSLGVIGLLTALIGDMAEMFGCLIGLEPTVTAITFVALGTSVPDLFASKAAVATEKYADNAIGNVTGSNSVNVFLGLGLPWTMAAIYHATKGTKFIVEAGDLPASVVVYSITAVIAIFMLFYRRLVCNAELGGGRWGKWISGLILIILWFGYIVVSALRAHHKIEFL